MIDVENLKAGLANFKNAKPFDHAVVDNFFPNDIARELEKEFLSYESDKWFVYDNQIEHKKALNDWNAFPGLTYKVLSYLNSDEFRKVLSSYVGVDLFADNGLHGGGWHIHGSGGNLNPHLDYSIHPKLGLQRKLNIIIYLSSGLKEEHGGHLGLWSHDPVTNNPGTLISEISPVFNRAVIFDTTQNSWHGMSRQLAVPPGVYRKSLAIYYLCKPDVNADKRMRALFAPRENQKNQPEVLDLIRKRSDVEASVQVYRR
jgi:Rps23 Pro-64 3,4-dihydroxylase Tpa1-like proline 4-hydroxylase